MFGDPVENEKGWEVKKLKDVGSIITGSTPSTSNSDNYASNDICFVKPSDIEKEGITTIKSTEFYVSNYAYDTVCRKLPKGSVLTTCIGIIGKVGVLSIDATCNQQINAVIPNPSMSSTYLAYAILSIRDYIQNVANAPVVPIINKGQFSSFQIPSPPLPLQQSFAQKIGSIEWQKELINQSIREAQTLFDSRMEYYFGE
jgi:type I restriction enzyme S subunit